MIYVGTIRPDPHWAVAPHLHHFHELIVVFSGRIHVQLAGQTVTGKPGDVLFYPGNTLHEERSNRHDPVETFFVGFDEEDAGGPIMLPPLNRDPHGRIRHLIGWLYAERDLCAAVDQYAPRAFLRAILAELQRQGNADQHQFVASVRDFIYEHIDQPIKLEDLARHAGMSRFHFLRKYRELAGFTPVQDLLRLRIEYARELLLTTNLPLKTIAPRSGLGNEYQLSRVFRKHFGIAPGRLRKLI